MMNETGRKLTGFTIKTCKLCGGRDLKRRCRLDNYKLDLLECAECSFRFVDFFNTVSQTAMDTGWDYSAHAASLAAKFSSYCKQIEQFLPLNGCRILDVGAGGGDFLKQARLRGAHVSGLDLDLSGVRFAREAYGIELEQKILEEAPYEPSSFDAISLWEVIEHLNRPREIVSAAAYLLKPGGFLLLSTPSRDSLWDKAAFALYDISFGLVQFPLSYRYSWTHLQIFSGRDMARLLKEHGFEIVLFERRMEFTYPLEDYLHRVGNRRLRSMLARLFGCFVKAVPVRNKMIVYARRRS
jgi:2-polyprenyl-6-hydroxyphenyl methylase/3-demethylubiquinone-9 3-methyltransferase